ncbi:hypothetical protein HMF7854_01310 [Sphingomonas ginkgonis]|uniref:S1/P1 Nuclease n=1 Tax=Sphingomonas ginkgonis TaxID=2315330 RepID=A0A3R9YKR6_9SPHN|nr:S1/P1 nuclease [Sphingomonas ginkgonis]RST32051.1 hypothetical protein HMF7854_01310 [Sphingomonas ginkgonis]
MRKLVPALAGLFALVLSAPASAWWEYGHQTVASIAWLSVRPETRARISELLRQEKLLDTPTCPAKTIEQASVWPDCVKPLGDRFSFAYSWHYQNTEICRPFSLKADCKDGNCVASQIDRNARLLADTTVPARERVMALAFLVHFVGDLAQPMHAAGHNGDRGGNDVKVNYGVVPSNLHSIWDGYLAERAFSTPPKDAAGILAQSTPAERARLAAGTTEDWSREGWELARRYAYGSILQDPCAVPAQQPTSMSEQTIRSLVPIVRRQALAGGLRLARLLDDALGPRHLAPGQKPPKSPVPPKPAG